MLSRISHFLEEETRSITAENKTGEKGGGSRSTIGVNAYNARELSKPWKINPYLLIQGSGLYTLADVKGSGKIQHIWMTCEPKYWRNILLKFYWENTEEPALITPIGDFFSNAWCSSCNTNSIPIVVNPSGGLNCYWEMPFLKQAKIEIEVLGDLEFPFFYQIDYCFCNNERDILYFSGYWNRSNPTIPMEEHVILPHLEGRGNYVGTFMGWQPNSSGVWVEGELKFYLDGDDKFPTINGTGTEDYFGGAWAWCSDHENAKYQNYSTAFSGMQKVNLSKNDFFQQPRFNLYRWHILDPICFKEDISVTIQPLGWRSEERYLPLKDDVCSLALWYQEKPINALSRVLNFEDYELI